MPPRKRTASAAQNGAESEPVAKRRSSRQAAAAATATTAVTAQPKVSEPKKTKNETSQKLKKETQKIKTEIKTEAKEEPLARSKKSTASEANDAIACPPTGKKPAAKKQSSSKAKDAEVKTEKSGARDVSEDPDVDDIPTVNPEAPRHDGEWYWLMKAEPETRLENGIDVRFSIDDLRAKKKPEGWDGIRAYAARNHMRNMNAGDKAFFYHSNCKEPGIVGVMEIVKEFSEDKSARRPGTPYYDPKSTKDKAQWSLVHVEFRKKFAVKIGLKELRELGNKGGPLEEMQMLKQSRLSVSRVQESEWQALCELADRKAEEAGLKHETGKL